MIYIYNPLQAIQELLQDIIDIVGLSLKVEGSIFDNNYNLLAYTGNYMKYKGTSVHSPFIKKVFEEQEIIVSNPGEMTLCNGCRFQHNCPASVEILHSIQCNNIPIGAISISSFNNLSDCLIDKDIQIYESVIKSISNLISKLVTEHENLLVIPLLKEMLHKSTNTSKEAIICIDDSGEIIQHNHIASSIFKTSNLNGLSLYKVMPNNKLTMIIKNKTLTKTKTEIDSKTYFLTSESIINNNQFSGAIIKLIPYNNVNYNKVELLVNKSTIMLKDIQTNNETMNQIKNKISILANSFSNVLIIGETGTGKELIAKSIHSESKRRNEPFIAVNCAAIPENLLESELFGYEEGSFTGALKKGKIGLFELADSGTIFLDEIGDMPLHLQAKLLRVLQEGTIRRVGSNFTQSIDVRVISATHQDLKTLVQDGFFRKDLYYRLDVVALKIPALRHRTEDIELLSKYFLGKYSNLLNRHIIGFSEDAQQLLLQYNWPGNIRELENVVEYAVNIEPTEFITSETLYDKLDCFLDESPSIPNIQSEIFNNLKDSLDTYERSIIENALKSYGNDLVGKKEVAKSLDIGLRTLYRKMELLGIS